MKDFMVRMVVVVIFAAGLIALKAQSSPEQARHDSQPVAGQQQNDTQNQDAKPFNGTIVKEKGKLVLKESATDMSYQLDDQEKAKPFEGKQVRITGRLDANNNLIHVENIEAAS